jgi:two-component system, LytTR family, sensor kinase
MNQPSFFSKRVLGNITVLEIFLCFLFYIAFEAVFYLALYLTIYLKAQHVYASEFTGWYVVFDFLIKALLTVPIWYTLFNRLRHKSILSKLLLHCIGLPLFVLAWGWLHKASSDWIGYTRLYKMDDKSSVWFDYYLPMVFYLVQFGVFHAYHFWKQSQRQIQKEKELMQLAYQSEVNALKAQIQPHFLFNTLNSISASVPPDQEETRELIAKLADTFRFSLKSSQLDLVPLQEEISFIQNCLELEAYRFKKRLEVQFEVDEQVLDVLIPPMLLQPIVENAIKHGISPSVKGGIIKVACIKDSEKVLIAVSDTGVGRLASFYDKDFEGIGLKNTSSRLWRHYQEKIQIEDNTPSGLRFSFHIPLQ